MRNYSKYLLSHSKRTHVPGGVHPRVACSSRSRAELASRK